MEKKTAGGVLAGIVLGAAAVTAAQPGDLKSRLDARNIEVIGGRFEVKADGGCAIAQESLYRPPPGDVMAAPVKVLEYPIGGERCVDLKRAFACAAARDYGISQCEP